MKRTAPPLPPNKTTWFLLNPEQFDINRLEANEMQQGDGTVIAMIPQIKDRIRIEWNENGLEKDVKLVVGRKTDAETGEITEETVFLGTALGGRFSGMMHAIDDYHNYFDTSGNMVYDPMEQKETGTGGTKKTTSDMPDDPDGTAIQNDSRDSENLAERLRRRVEEELKEKNQVQVGDTTFVRIPKIPGIRMLPPNQQGLSLIEYKHDQWYDPIKRQSRNKKTIIGQASDEYADAMIPNDRYRQIFNIDTGLPHNYKTPEEEERYKKVIQEIMDNAREFRKEMEEEKQRKEEVERRRKLYGENSPDLVEDGIRHINEMFSKAYDEDPETCDEDPEEDEDSTDVTGETDMTNDRTSEKTDGGEMAAEEDDIQKLHAQVHKDREQDRERMAILRLILDSVTKAISNHARKRPNDIINVYKARKINDILIETRVRYQGSGYEDLLELIKEPEEVEENGPKYLTGMTYSDAEVLLTHYTTVIEHIRMNSKK